MRQRIFSPFTGLTLVALLAFAGCSDDKSTGSDGNGGISITDDQSAMQSELNATSDSLIVFLADAFESRASLGVGGDIDPVFYTPIDNDSDVVASTYDTTSGWHQVVVTRIATAYNQSRIDSIQFRNEGGDYQRQGGSAHAMTYRHHFNRQAVDTTTEYYNRSGVWGYDLSGLQTNQATIDGTTEITTSVKYLDNTDTTVWRTYTISATVSNLTVERVSGGWNSICPSSGTVSGTMTTTYKRADGETISRTWTITAEFTDGTAAISVSLGSKDWQTDRSVCTIAN